MGRDDDGAETEGGPKGDDSPHQNAKRLKGSSSSEPQAGQGTGTVPMQLALTPFGNGRPPPPLRPIVMDV